MKRKWGWIVAVALVFGTLGFMQIEGEAAPAGGSGGHPAFKSTMVNYTPNHVTMQAGKSLYSLSYEYHVSGISNAKD